MFQIFCIISKNNHSIVRALDAISLQPASTGQKHSHLHRGR